MRNACLFPWPFFDKYEKFLFLFVCVKLRADVQKKKEKKKVVDAAASLTPRGCMPGARFKLFFRAHPA